jgi:hypothetical protein
MDKEEPPTNHANEMVPIKLTVWATVLTAFDFVWSERWPFLTLAFPAVAVHAVMITTLTVIWGGAPYTEVPVGPITFTTNVGIGGVALLVTYVVLMLRLWVTFCVRWHRRSLVQDEAATLASTLRWGQRQTRFLSLCLGIVFLGTFLTSLGAALGSLILEPQIVAVLLNICAFYIYARLAFLFPSTAVDYKMSFRESWELTRGNGLRLLLMAFIIVIPIGWLTSLLDNLVVQFQSWQAILIGNFANAFFIIIGFAVVITALSTAYRYLLSGPTTEITEGRSR